MLNTTFLQGNYIPEANWYLRKAHQKRKTRAQYQLPDKAQKGLPVHLCWTGTPLKIQTSIPELLPPAERKPRRFQNKKLSACGFSLWHFFPSLLFSSTCFLYALIIARGFTLSTFFQPQFPDRKTFPYKIIGK